MITQEQWFKHPSFAAELAVALRIQAVDVALDVVAGKAFKPSPVPPVGVDLRDHYAILGARKEGYLEALANLRMLAESRPPPKPLRPPFANAEPPGKPLPQGDSQAA